MLFRNEILYIDNAIGLGYNKYNGQKYVYRKNLQGDIVAILDECGCTRGTYEYDAWGNIIWQGGSELLTINPFRYRGYYYDEETGLYYLNSRYYDPETGRFISPDSLKYLEPETCNGLNLYAYCGNNPVMFVDPTGHLILSLIVVAATSAIFSAVSSIFVQLVTTQTINWGQVGISSLFGAIGGLLAFTGIGGIAEQFFIQGALSLGESISLAAVDGSLSGFSVGEGLLSFFVGGAFGTIGAGKAAQKFKSVLQMDESLVGLLKRGFSKEGIAGLIGTWAEKSIKYSKKFLKPTVISEAITTIFNTFLNWASFYLVQLF